MIRRLFIKNEVFGFRNILKREFQVGLDTLDNVLGRETVSKIVSSIGNNGNLINHSTSNVSSWEWIQNLESIPKLSIQDLKSIVKNSVDPFVLVDRDISTLAGCIKELIGSDHPVLESCAKYFFDIDSGKKIRPAMVLLVSYALNTGVGSARDNAAQVASPAQKRLAEITEMIHTASLFHDDVIDKASTRRGAPSVNQVFGNKLAILGGDFLLSRASVALARLRNLEVVELLSMVIEHLVKGEIMQMRPPVASGGKNDVSLLEHYLHKNFYKTASLMANSCLAASVLGGFDEQACRASYLFGAHTGQAFQLIDDALDFEGSLSSIGKAPLADLKSGLATAPTLFAAQEHPDALAPLIARRFEAPGDLELAVSLVSRSQGLERTKRLAQVHCEAAMEVVQKEMRPGVARDALVALACRVVLRTS